MKKGFGVLLIIVMIICFYGCGQSACKHDFIEISREDATCSAEGKLVLKCDLCKQEKTESIEKTRHNYDDGKVTTAATCTTTGIKTFTCIGCSTTRTEAIEKASHTYDDGKITTAATCTATGTKTFTCVGCGTTKNETIVQTPHNYVEKLTAKATCTTEGKKTTACTICGDSKTESVAKLSHTYSSATCTDAAKCSTCGNTNGVALGHEWSEATCTTSQTCNRCATVYGESLGHTKGSDGNCTRCGEKLAVNMKTIVGNPDECSTIKYFGFSFYKNSVDGIKVCWGGQNLSGKTINYYTVTVYFYNSVGDPAYSEITGKSSKTVKYVGPVEPNKDLIVYGVVDYVPVCSKVVIGEITLDYADGTSDSGWYGWSTTHENSALK